MKLNQKTKYAFRALAYVASHPKGTWLTTKNIAEACNIPAGILEIIITQLAKEQIILTLVSYGSTLAKKPNETTLLKIMEAMEGSATKSLVLLEEISEEPWYKKMKLICGNAIVEQNKVLSEATLEDIVEG